MRAVLILRPQPGADETAGRARAHDLEPVVAPLFTIVPIDWTAPEAGGHDAILFTSANAPRHGGPGLAAFGSLPCYCVGDATAAAATQAGFGDVRTGPSDGAAAARLMADDGVRRVFHPSGADVTAIGHAGLAVEQVPVYRADAADRLPDVAVSAILSGAIVLLHSPRAAATFSDLIGARRERTRVAAAAGSGWAGVAVASEPRDDALLSAAEELVPLPVPAFTAPEPPPYDEPAETRRRSWLWLLILALILFLLGAAAMGWVLTRWDVAGRYLNLAPPPPAAVVQAPPALLPAQPVPDQPASPRGSDTIVIDPDVARRVAQLEQRIGELGSDARTAVGNADRAEGLLVAFAARRALDRGVGLGYLEGLLRQRFGRSQPQAVGTIITAAGAPITLQALQEGLAEVGPQVASGGPGRGYWDALRRELATLVTIRREGSPATDPRERLRRATSRLEAGQVEVALAEVLRLPGRDYAQEWIDAAQRYVAARQALDTIEVAALLEPRMPPQQPGAPATPTPTPTLTLTPTPTPTPTAPVPTP